MKNIVIPIYGSRISSRLDCAEFLQLLKVSDNNIQSSETVRLIPNNSLEKVSLLIRMKPDVLICGGITKMFKNKLEENEIEVIPWVSGEVDDIISIYLSGKLTKKIMSNKKNKLEVKNGIYDNR